MAKSKSVSKKEFDEYKKQDRKDDKKIAIKAAKKVKRSKSY